MDKDIKETINKLSKENMDKLSKYRKQLQQELYDKCISLGGHLFWPQQTHRMQMLIGARKTVSQTCQYCRYEKILKEERLLPVNYYKDDEEDN